VTTALGVDGIALAADDDTSAAAAEELTTIAGQYGTTVLRAEADRARGAVRLAAADARTALAALRDAWHGVARPGRAVRSREGARAHRLLGLPSAWRPGLGRARLDSARRVFARLADYARLDRAYPVRTGPCCDPRPHCA